jgi:hypothetical protein
MPSQRVPCARDFSPLAKKGNRDRCSGGELSQAFVFVVQEEAWGGGEALEGLGKFPFGMEVGLVRTVAFQVVEAYIGEESPGGADEVGEKGHFAGVVVAYFQDGVAVVWMDAEERKRQSQAVIPAFWGGEGGGVGGEDMGEQGAGSSFAVGAADSDDVQMREALSIVGGFFLEEGERFVMGESLFGGEVYDVSGRYYHSGGALF